MSSEIHRPGPIVEGSNSRHWEAEAEHRLAWTRTPGHNLAYVDFGPLFFEMIVPPPLGLTLEVGCGEGRVMRDLAARGHTVIGVDSSPTLLSHARAAAPYSSYILADAASLPLVSSSVDLVVAHNSLMDIDDLPGAVREAARVLRPGGRLAVCVTHPVADAGGFPNREAGSPFVIEDSYLGTYLYSDIDERDGLLMHFRGWRHSFEVYSKALEAAGLVIERLREPAYPSAAPDSPNARWTRVPMFLFLRCLKV
jgi:SAM-dependent methyltransferase